MLPTYWIQFITKNNLVGREIEIPSASDGSRVGVCMEILSEAQSIEEATMACPGIQAIVLGYVPVGGCSLGSGDPYFIRKADGERGPLFRICHDVLTETGDLADGAIVEVLKDYTVLLEYIVGR